MLMMTRKRGERLYVGEIEIIVSEIARSHVRLAVRAPAGQLILRGEVRDTIEAQNRAAAQSELAPPKTDGPPVRVEAQDLKAFVGKRT
jgi:carbon storage regulator CsrA